MKKTDIDTHKYSLDDFVGYDYIKEDINEIIEILQNPQMYLDANVELPKGLILSGRPGLGKTLLVKIIAAQTGLRVFNFNASEEKTSANKVCRQITQTFKMAIKHSPSIIVLDELDRMIPSEDFISDKSRSILSTLLTNLDGFKSDHANVFVIATTNGWGDIDDALKRSGRLDRRISIYYPTTESREMLCDFYLKKIKNITYSDSLAKQLSVKTTGFSCADIKKLINDAMIYCIKNNKSELKFEDLSSLIIKIKINDLPAPLKQEEKRVAAYHELGHLVANYKLFDVLSDVIIKGFDNADGANFIDEDDSDKIQSCTRDTLANTAQGYLAGRAAEELFVGDVSFGYIEDLNTIRKMWCYCYGNGVFDINKCFVVGADFACENSIYQNRTYCDDKGIKEYCSQFKLFMSQQYEKSIAILKENTELIQYLYNILIQKEFLCKEELKALIDSFEENKKNN